MKPAARLHILRQREYRKVCPDQRPRFGGPERDLNPSWSAGQYGQGSDLIIKHCFFGIIYKIFQHCFVFWIIYYFFQTVFF
jgi:hypothetical protein